MTSEDMDLAVQRITQAYEAFNRGAYDEASKFVHPDMTWNRVADFETTLEGKDAIRRNMDPEIFSEQRAEVLSVEAVGNCVVVRSNFHAKGAGSGIEIAQEGWSVWRMRGGMAIEFRHFAERDEAVAAAREASPRDA
jgi:ketosteroid isomerase-like protein